MRGATGQISALINELSIEEGKEERIRSVKKILEATKDDRELLESYFVTDNTIARSITKVESAARSVAIELDITSVGIEGSESNELGVSETLNMRLIIEGTWSNVVHFVSLVEHLPYNIDILSFQMQNSRGSDDESIWRGTITLRFLKLK